MKGKTVGGETNDTEVRRGREEVVVPEDTNVGSPTRGLCETSPDLFSGPVDEEGGLSTVGEDTPSVQVDGLRIRDGPGVGTVPPEIEDVSGMRVRLGGVNVELLTPPLPP